MGCTKSQHTKKNTRFQSLIKTETFDALLPQRTVSRQLSQCYACKNCDFLNGSKPHYHCEYALLEEYGSFLRNYSNYDKTLVIDTLRKEEYGRLDKCGQIYLDYTGASIYGQNQIDACFNLMKEGCLGNPHSLNPTSNAMSDLINNTREYIQAYFNAGDEYEIIFTPNATGAIKLVGESFPFTDRSRYLICADDHNSINGIRWYASQKGAQVTYFRPKLPDMRIAVAELDQELEYIDTSWMNLLAYPAQSNFTGVQHDMDWIAEAHSRGWYVLLDAAAFVPTNKLDLSVYKPDFVPISFYKMFGFPTGCGCLIVKKSAMQKLRRPWFAGGTITIASTYGEDYHYLHTNHEGFEDGTTNFLNIPCVKIGLQHINKVSIELIHERVICLTGWLLQQMQLVQHSNGSDLVQIYGPKDMEQRGATIAWNFFDPKGRSINSRAIELLANDRGISLRTGCFCNPGAGEIIHGLDADSMSQAFGHDEPVYFENFLQLAAQKF